MLRLTLHALGLNYLIGEHEVMKLLNGICQQRIALKVFFLVAFEYHIDTHCLGVESIHLHEQLGKVATLPQLRHIDNSHDTTGFPFACVEQLIIEIGKRVVLQDFSHRIEDFQIESRQHVDSHDTKRETRNSEVSPEFIH